MFIIKMFIIIYAIIIYVTLRTSFEKMDQNILLELKSTSLFSSCNESDIEDLLSKPHIRKVFKKNDYIVRANDDCNSLILLTKGKVFATIGSEEGREMTMEHHDAPKILASAFLFSIKNNIPVYIEAKTDCVIWFINRDILFDFMIAHPKVMRCFLQETSTKAQILAQKVKGFAVKGLRSRVLDYLRQQKSINNISKTAKIMGVARPSLSRILKDMIDDNYIEKREDGYYLK